MATEIHPTAIVHGGALLDEDVYVGPYCIVGEKVRVGSSTRLDSHVVIEGRTDIGKGCRVAPFACIGQPPQDMKYKGEDTAAIIGDNNTIREYVTIHRASVGGDGVTSVGDDNFLMAYVHIAHDCKVGSHVIMANYVGLSGHVLVEDHVIIGGLTGLHQFARIGCHAMVGGMSRIINDVPPYVIVAGAEKAHLYGLNTVGLKRKGFSDEAIGELKKAYKILFRDKHTMGEAIRKVQEELPYAEHIRHLVEFIQKNKRGICR